MLNSYIWPIDRALSGVTTPDLSEPGSDGKEELLHILQSSRIADASSSDCLMSYPRQSLEESYPSAEIQSMYTTAPADWDRKAKKYNS